MSGSVALRERFMKEPPARRLGALAANLARVQSFSNHPDHGDVVARLLEESKWFIEWTAPEAESATQAALVDCQRVLARWTRAWDRIWSDPEQKDAVSEAAGSWSRRFLELSGLLSPSSSGAAPG